MMNLFCKKKQVKFNHKELNNNTLARLQQKATKAK